MLRSTIARFGLSDGILHLLNRVLARVTGRRVFVQHYHFIALATDTPVPLPRRLASNMDTAVLTAAEIPELDVPRPSEKLRSRLRDGSMCFVTRRDEDFVGFIWLKRDAYVEDEVRSLFVLPTRSRTIWDYDLYVAPNFRKSAAFMKIWHDSLEFLRSENVDWTISRISAFAPESLRAHMRLGGKIIGGAYYFCFFSAQITLTAQSPYFHLSFSDRSMPSIRLEAPLSD